MKLPCPVCGREVRLTLDCRLYSHCPPGGGHPRCSGSGEGYRVMVAPIPDDVILERMWRLSAGS
jgi:hypothetical protein